MRAIHGLVRLYMEMEEEHGEASFGLGGAWVRSCLQIPNDLAGAGEVFAAILPL